MKTHSTDFKNQLTELGRELRGIITYDDITLEEEINSITPHYEADILKSVMKQLDLELTVDIPLETVIKCQIGILVNGDYEMLDFGNYVVYKSEKQEDTDTYAITCYDKMLYSMKEYEDLGVSYPISIKNYLTALGNKIGLNVANSTFYNQSLTIPSELYLGQNYTYRDVLDEIAQATGSIICINDNDEIEVRYTNDLTQYNQAEGTSIEITDAEDFQVKEIKITGNSKQDGTPTPDNPIPIKNTGDSGSVNEKVQNKNLIKLKSTLNTTRNNVEISYNEQSKKIKFTGTINSTFTYSGTMSLDEPLTPGTYVLSIDGNNRAFMYLRNSQGNVVKNVQTTNPVVTITEEVTSLNFGIEGLSNGATVDIEIGYQLEQGSTATDYIAHEEQNISFPLAQGQKFLQGDYLADDGVHHVMGEIILDGSNDEGWTRSGTNTSNQYRFSSSVIANIVNKPSSGSDIVDVLCSHFIKESADKTYSKNNGIAIHPNGRIFIFDDSFKEYTTEEFKAVLSQNPITLQYPLAEEVIEPYTEEQQAVWEQIKALRTYKPVTHISSTDEVPATVDVTYATNLEKIDEDYLKDINVTFGEMYGPVNSIVLSRAEESDSVYLQDVESVQKNGLCEIKISDNQIMNFNNRSDFLPGILEALNGLTYSINDFNSTGILYYDLGDFYYVSIGENLYKCLMLNDEIDVTTGIEEIIHTNMPEKSETDYEKADKTDRRINQTYLIVDKQNQTIESVVNNVTEQNNKISRITQTVDEINSKISDIADITTYGESDRAYVELQEINQSEPIMIKVHPTSENISYLYPRENLYPSDLQYLPNRIIRFTRTYEEDEEILTENIDYELPDDLLRYSDTVYDEFYLNYDSGTCQVIKRCAYNADGTVRALGTEITTDYPYPTIGLGDGNYTITLLGYDFGYLYVRLMAKNIYTTQFYTKVETNSQINQKADEINLGVSQTLTNYSTTNEMNSAITVKANEINSTVSQKVGKNEVISSINQSAESVTINANKINLAGKTINLTSDNIKIASNNFNVDKNGNLTCSNADITGGSFNVLATTGATDTTFRITNRRNESEYTYVGPVVYYSKGSGGYIQMQPKSSVASNSLILLNGSSTTTLMDTGITTPKVTQTSLESEKKNFEKLQKGLDLIKGIDIYKYNLKNEDDKTKKHIGFVIGDNFNYSKEITSNENNGVDIYSFVSVCCKAIQEQQEQIEQMKKEIKELKGGNE